VLHHFRNASHPRRDRRHFVKRGFNPSAPHRLIKRRHKQNIRDLVNGRRLGKIAQKFHYGFQSMFFNFRHDFHFIIRSPTRKFSGQQEFGMRVFLQDRRHGLNSIPLPFSFLEAAGHRQNHILLPYLIVPFHLHFRFIGKN